MIFRHQLAVHSPIVAAAELRAVASALRLATDPRPVLLELLLREYDAEGGVLCGSGTQALQLAITTAIRLTGGVGPVALPAFSCFDVASAAIGAGVPIALYDIDPDTLAPDVESLGRVMADGVRVAVIAPLYGMPVDWELLEALAARHGALLIEDAAQGHGASWRGRKLGSLGTISTLSFGRGKGWTGGSGGAVLFRGAAATVAPEGLPSEGVRSEVATVVSLIAQWLLGRPAIYGIPRSLPGLGLGVTTYRAPSAVVSISRAAAAAVLANRDVSLTEAAARRSNAHEFLARPIGVGTLAATRFASAGEPGYLRLPLRVVGGSDALGSREQTGRLGIERSYPCTLGELPEAAARLTGAEQSWLGASTLSAQLFTVPTHSLVGAGERREIEALLARAPSP